MRFKVGAMVAVLGIAASAQANGAMGLGLEMWDLRYWLAYVVAMVALEAWLIGRWLKISWIKSAVISIVANAVTGGLGAASGFFAPFLHISIIGSSANPSPFPNAIALLTLFAIPSGWIESIVWRWATRTKDVWPFVKHVLLVHLITVPIGLAILLIPERPYPGLEITTAYGRRAALYNVSIALENYVRAYEALPGSQTVDGLARELVPHSFSNDSDMTVALHHGTFSRFSTGDSWQHPFEINPELVGMPLIIDEKAEEQWVWYLRTPDMGTGYRWGLVIDLNTGDVRPESDSASLGDK